jgi:hypothetical protein
MTREEEIRQLTAEQAVDERESRGEYPPDLSPIQLLGQLLEATEGNPDLPNHSIDTVLVPEQCMSIWIGDKQYHVMIQEMPS